MSRNDITGDNLITRPTNKDYEKGWDALFGKNSLQDTTEKAFEGAIESVKEKMRDENQKK